MLCLTSRGKSLKGFPARSLVVRFLDREVVAIRIEILNQLWNEESQHRPYPLLAIDNSALRFEGVEVGLLLAEKYDRDRQAPDDGIEKKGFRSDRPDGSALERRTENERSGLGPCDEVADLVMRFANLMGLHFEIMT